LRFKELRPDCAPFLVALNGDPLQWTSHMRPAQAWSGARYESNWNVYPSTLTFEPVQGELIEFDISNTSLRQGVNEVEIQLETGEALDLVDVRLWIRYQPAG